MEKKKKLIFAASGIFVCYFYFGVFQEQITKAQYVTDDGRVEAFTYAMSLALLLSLVNLVFAKLVSLAVVQEDSTATGYYCANAVTYILAMVCTYMSLQFVNYPTQVVAKSCKPIPVMLLGVLLGRKSYSWKKYFFVFMIVFGVALFMYKDKKSSTASEGIGFGETLLFLALNMDGLNTGFVFCCIAGIGFGETLLFLALVMDGLNGAIQERMMADHQTKFIPLMLNINLWASIYLLAMVLLTGELFQFISFVQRHPAVIWQLMTLSLAGCFGQLFIFITVSEFGPLHSSIVTTVRKLFTVLFSVLFFGNALLPRQWLGTAIVFAGLFLDVMYGKSPPKHK